MMLPTCWSCHSSFKWKELLFVMGPKKCTKCDAKQYVTAKKRRQAVWFAPVMVVSMFFMLSVFNMSFLTGALFGLLLIIIGGCLIPFTYKFTDEEEPLF